MTHADSVPAAWWERSSRNSWYSRELHKVVLPDTIRHKNNFVLTEEEVVQYVELMREERDRVQREFQKVLMVRDMMQKGRLPLMTDFTHQQPLTVCFALEAINDAKKAELKVTKWLVEITRRLKEKRNAEVQGNVVAGAQEGVHQDVRGSDGDGS